MNISGGNTRNIGMLIRIEKKFPGASEYVHKRLLICGSRDYSNRLAIASVIRCFYPYALINGCAPGADTIANEEFRKLGKKPEEYPADWDRYDNAAGPIRNTQMLEEGKPDIVIAFFSGKRSRGTNDMVTKARNAGVFTIELGIRKRRKI